MTEVANQDDRLAEFLQKLPPGDASKLMVGFLKEIAEDAVRHAIPVSLREFYEQIGYSDEVPTLLEDLTARTGESGAVILRKALRLLSAAWDAEEEGNRIAILTPDDEIVQDVVGIHPKPTTTMTLVQ
jgi:hypothetical protein